VAVAGITADANIIINYARLEAQRYFYIYGEPIPLEHLLQIVCDLKQSYTQWGGLRPFGVSFLFAGWDEQHGFQLYQSDPSGNYGGWKAQAIGNNDKAAQSVLRSDYKEGKMELKDGVMLATKVLSKTMDTTVPTPDKLEIATVTKDEDGKVVYHVYTKSELSESLKEYAEWRKKNQSTDDESGESSESSSQREKEDRGDI